MQTNVPEAPPVYTEYPTALPERFPIGKLSANPLVNVTELQAHLKLLGAFHRLKQTVQAQVEGIAAMDKERAWVTFVNRAVYRFYAYTSNYWRRNGPDLDENMLPPLDVIMVWHTYLLNPRAYYEDSRRTSDVYSNNLTTLENMPLWWISSLIDDQTLDPLPPSNERQAFFEQTSFMPWEMPLITGMSDVLSLDCPYCLQKNYFIRWLDYERGFANTGFSHLCERCGKLFNKDAIGVRRFAEEVSRRRAGQRVFLSETLLDPLTGKIDEKASKDFTEKALKYLDGILKVIQPIDPNEIKSKADTLAEKFDYNHKKVGAYLHMGLRPPKFNNNKPIPRLQRLSVAYSHAGLASLDLVGAVLRQGSFIEKMAELGWTQPGRFTYTKDLAPLVRSIARYHAFLDLMSQNPNIFFVPTLDIDLAWHTHQLYSPGYRAATMKYIGRTPNHDDNVDAVGLSTGYDHTAKAWRARFGVPYSVCGCVPDPDQESRLSRIASKITNIGKKEEEVVPVAPVNSRPDLVSIEEDEADSSHPSEHNVVFGDPKDRPAVKKGAQREKHSQKCVSSAKKGAAKDPWRGLQAQRSENRNNHREAFTDPYYGNGAYYPYWGVSAALPVGFYGGYVLGSGYGACGAGCGSVGAGGCSNCSSGGGSCGGGGGASCGSSGCGGGGCGGCGGG